MAQNKSSRVCNTCKHEKSLSAFRKRNKVFGGGTYASCKECVTKAILRKEEKNNLAPGRQPEIDINQPLKLNFLLDLNGWTKEEIKFFLLTVQKYKQAPYRMDLRDIYKKYFPFRSGIICGKLLKEFVTVAEEGIEFDEYMKTDRKFRRDGKKILAGKK